MKRCRCIESFYDFSTNEVYFYNRVEPYIMKNNVWYLKDEEDKRGKNYYKVVYEVMVDGDKEFFTERCFHSSFIDIRKERKDKIMKLSECRL